MTHAYALYASALRRVLVIAVSICSAAVTAGAQVRDSVTRATPPSPATQRPTTSTSTIPGLVAPPITAKRAFLLSLAVPGYGQSRLDRGTSGALFASVELAAWVMVRRSLSDVREAKRYRLDSLPAQFDQLNGILVASGLRNGRFSADLERARRLHVEDWIAVIVFNHLFAGADAFVGAQLYDVPVDMSVRSSSNGAAIVASFRW